MIREDNPVLGKTIVYSYNAGGNILSKIEYPYTTNADPSTNVASENIQILNYTYSADWRDKLESYAGKAITYDAIGNPLTYDGWNFTWEQGRQLKSISNTGLNKDVSFKYNDAGIRTEKTVDNVITKYHLVDDKVTYETNGTDEIYYTYDHFGKVISMTLNNAEYFYTRNGQGDIIGLIDSDGNEVASYVYDSWGKLISIKDGSGEDKTTVKTHVGYKNPYRYRGYRYDNETGLYYLNSRYYNPEWGRFVNADTFDVVAVTLDDVTDKNLFAYCDNNPVVRADEGGYFWHIVAGAAIGAGFELYGQVKSGQGINLGKIVVSAASGGIGAALGPISGAIVSGAFNSLLGIMDGNRDLSKLGMDFAIGASASLIGSGAGKLASKIGGRIAIKSMSKLPKSVLKSKVITKIPLLKGSERNAIKNISILKKHSEQLVGKTIPQVFNSSIGSAFGYGSQRLLYY